MDDKELTAKSKPVVTLSARIIRADGTIVELGQIASSEGVKEDG